MDAVVQIIPPNSMAIPIQNPISIPAQIAPVTISVEPTQISMNITVPVDTVLPVVTSPIQMPISMDIPVAPIASPYSNNCTNFRSPNSILNEYNSSSNSY